MHKCAKMKRKQAETSKEERDGESSLPYFAHTCESILSIVLEELTTICLTAATATKVKHLITAAVIFDSAPTQPLSNNFCIFNHA